MTDTTRDQPDVNVHVFIATSADGFIADESGSVGWLNEENAKVTEGEDCGFAAHMASVQCILMGRKSFESVLGFGDDAWPYGEKPLVVLTASSAAADSLNATIQTKPHLRRVAVLLNRNRSTPARQLACQAARLAASMLHGDNAGLPREDQKVTDLYVDGGQVIQAFLDATSVDTAIITEVPAVLGAGRPLFTSEAQKAVLNLVKEHTFPFGFVQRTFTRKS